MIKNPDKLPKIIEEIKNIESSGLHISNPAKYNFFIGRNLGQLFEDEIGSSGAMDLDSEKSNEFNKYLLKSTVFDYQLDKLDKKIKLLNDKGINVLNYEITDEENQENTLTLDESKFFNGKKVSDLLNEIKTLKQNDVGITDDDYVKKSLEKFNTMDSEDIARKIFKMEYANACLDDLSKSINNIEKENKKSIAQEKSPTHFQDLLNRNNINQDSSIGKNL